LNENFAISQYNFLLFGCNLGTWTKMSDRKGFDVIVDSDKRSCVL